MILFGGTDEDGIVPVEPNEPVDPAEGKFKYETHLHTSESSACGKNTGVEMARVYKEAGYDAIIVTDHFYRGNTRPNKNQTWEAWVNEFCKGYENAKAEGDKIGLKVFFGWEETYDGLDFLVYGLDKEWLLAHPEIKSVTIEEQYKIVKENGGMVIQAHPFREEYYIRNPRVYEDGAYCDGIEVLNASHFSKYGNNGITMNEKALKFAQEHDLLMTGGSDIHSTDLFYGGMAFDKELNSIEDFIAAVLNKEDCVIMDIPKK